MFFLISVASSSLRFVKLTIQTRIRSALIKLVEILQKKPILAGTASEEHTTPAFHLHLRATETGERSGASSCDVGRRVLHVGSHTILLSRLATALVADSGK